MLRMQNTAQAILNDIGGHLKSLCSLGRNTASVCLSVVGKEIGVAEVERNTCN